MTVVHSTGQFDGGVSLFEYLHNSDDRPERVESKQATPRLKSSSVVKDICYLEESLMETR